MSKRFYITLNHNKDKDLVILEYLSSTYNEAETIKSILYQVATNRCYEVNLENNQLGIEISKEVQIGERCTEKVQMSKSDKDNSKSEIDIDDDIRNLFG